MRSLLAALLIVFVALCGAPASAASSPPEGLPEGVELPVKVRIGLRVLDITEIREVIGRARLYIEVTQRWTDPRRRFDPLDAGTSRIDRVGAEARQYIAGIWTPGLAIDNQLGEPRAKADAVSVYSDGSVVLVERYEADFRVGVDMAAFPFDRQRLSLSFSLPRYAKQDAMLVTTETDRLFSRIEPKLSVIDWRPLDLTFFYDEAAGWNARAYSRLNATVGIERLSERYLLRLFIPIVSTLAVSLFVLWIPGTAPKDHGSLVFSALLALAAISFTYEASFPGSISLNTPIAKIISLGYFYLVVVVLIDALLWKPRSDPASRYHVLAMGLRSHCRWALPSIMVIVCLALVLRGLPG
ncbi:neurotransmitter-gated ion-channel ligand-binding protein [Rhodopseudomonas sp. G2_2311]|uniref:neurotransmitter-gated ion-channel ligand-binding protein n=1 Tax=Rhodopseudomonas sp. G2_2311 TaxID=3114287 RepID=UPI0038B5546A